MASQQNLFREDLGQRRYDLDWVRIVAFMLLIAFHVGMYYVDWDWHVKSPHASAAMEPFMMLTSPWRLSLLFLVSGVATGFLLARQGAASFVGQRSKRLLIPLVFGMLVIVPPQSYLEVVEKLRYAGSFAEFYRLYITGFHGFCRGSDCLIMPTWNHLWFVAYLWVYTLVLYGLVRLMPPMIPWLRRVAERRLAGLGILSWPILYLCAIRLELAPRFPENHALVGDWYNHALYFGMFVLGFVLAAVPRAWDTLARTRWISLGFAVLGWAFICAYLGAYAHSDAVPPTMLRLVWRAAYGAQQWLAIAAIAGFAHRHLNRDNAARRYLTAAIFPVYILHQTIIVVLAHALKPSDLFPPLEGILLVLVTAAACFLSYEAIRRVPLLRPLFGLDNAAAKPAKQPGARSMPTAESLVPRFAVPQDIN
jgi:surface polysaccharide O-acyltransferase-like enzyme